jgi:hypothetical protein
MTYFAATCQRWQSRRYTSNDICASIDLRCPESVHFEAPKGGVLGKQFSMNRERHQMTFLGKQRILGNAGREGLLRSCLEPSSHRLADL